MKSLAMLLFAVSAMAQTPSPSRGIEALGTDTLSESSRPAQPGLSTVAKVEQVIFEDMKMKCDAIKGCALFVDGGKGFDFKVSVGAGEGPNYSNGNGGGINIYSGSNSGEYYGFAITLTYSNYTCTRYVSRSTYQLIETYQLLMASPEYVNRVFAAWKKGEDMPTPDAVKSAMSLHATIKPSQTNCGQRINN